MKILVSNDDGYQAPGLLCLVETLKKIAEVTVIAPERNRSAASNSLTLEYPLRVKTAPNGFFYVNGTPTDCVHLALSGLFDTLPDMVIAGINSGANLGDDVIYSGTVAAAMEGRFLGLPALAISTASFTPQYYQTAATVVKTILSRLQADDLDLPINSILNINVPDCPWKDLKGMQATRLGSRHRAEPSIKSLDPHNHPVYWIGPAGLEQDAGFGTDFHAINHSFVSITPLHVDLTRHSALSSLGNWLAKD
ncbi:MAG: 5'/3'-nucleotidase SurE [Thiomargarita sp.]|nr:5'/3'-nucleotidase SurE [Thiomargarita sp.]